MIQSWTFVDEKGQPVPATADGYGTLPIEFTNIIDAELVSRLYGGQVDSRFLASMNALTSKSNSSSESEMKSVPDTTTCMAP